MFAGTDIVIAIIVLLFAIIGVLRGLLNEVLALLSFILAIVIPVLFADEIMALFYSPASGEIDEFYHKAVYAFVFALIFISILLIGMAGLQGMGKIFSGWLAVVNHILGGAFGFVHGVAICLALLMLGVFVSPDITNHQWWRQSELIPLLTPLANHVVELLPSEYQILYKTGFIGR